MLIPTIGLAINVGGVCRSFWLAGQVGHSEEGDRRRRQKVLIPTIDESHTVDGVGRLI